MQTFLEFINLRRNFFTLFLNGKEIDTFSRKDFNILDAISRWLMGGTKASYKTILGLVKIRKNFKKELTLPSNVSILYRAVAPESIRDGVYHPQRKLESYTSDLAAAKNFKKEYGAINARVVIAIKPNHSEYLFNPKFLNDFNRRINNYFINGVDESETLRISDNPIKILMYK